jgi:hypothetical protein
MTKEKVFTINYPGIFAIEETGDNIAQWLMGVEADENTIVIVKIIKSDDETT